MLFLLSPVFSRIPHGRLPAILRLTESGPFQEEQEKEITKLGTHERDSHKTSMLADISTDRESDGFDN